MFSKKKQYSQAFLQFDLQKPFDLKTPFISSRWISAYQVVAFTRRPAAAAKTFESAAPLRVSACVRFVTRWLTELPSIFLSEGHSPLPPAPKLEDPMIGRFEDSMDG